MEDFNQEDLIEKWIAYHNGEIADKPEDLVTFDEFLDDLKCFYYSGVELGQKGNGYYLGHSNTKYLDFIYAYNDEEEKDVVIRYIVDEYPYLGKVLVEAWVLEY